jgi:hypothetical protein
MAHAVLISPAGYRTPPQINRIIREKSHVEGSTGNIVEWQSLRTQEYRYRLLVGIAHFWELFGVRRPVRYEPPVPAGEYDPALLSDEVEGHSLLADYLKPEPEPQAGGPPKETTLPEE